jgi:energy-coupling factor transporter ATP-binding protein EcfA2
MSLPQSMGTSSQPLSEQVRISLVGASGAGKSTAALFMQSLVPETVMVSVAQPLRDIEDRIYEILGRPRPIERISQDGKLLQQIREILLTRDEDILRKRFVNAVAAAAPTALIVNADCRRAMEPTLRRLGFRFVFVDGDHATARRDETKAIATPSQHDAVIMREDCDLVLDNSGSLDDLLVRIRVLLEQLIERR